jgi:hypothetical protein
MFSYSQWYQMERLMIPLDIEVLEMVVSWFNCVCSQGKILSSISQKLA